MQAATGSKAVAKVGDIIEYRHLGDVLVGEVRPRQEEHFEDQLLVLELGGSDTGAEYLIVDDQVSRVWREVSR